MPLKENQSNKKRINRSERRQTPKNIKIEEVCERSQVIKLLETLIFRRF